MATTSFVFGLSSLLLPLLSIPGVILGVVSLRRIGRNPALGGRDRSIAGIVTSVILGPLVVIVIVIVVAGSGQVGSPGFSWVPIHPDRPTPDALPLPATLSLSNPTGAVVLPAQATLIFNSLWTLRQEAFSNNNRSLMAEFETGPALESDESTCGCETRVPRGRIIHESLLVPRESSFPATFLGEATTTLGGSSYVQYLIVSRQSAVTPWQVVSDPGFSGTAPLDQPTSGSGFDGGATTSSGRAADSLPASLAAYWQAWTDRGHAPPRTNFAAGRWTTGAGRVMAKAPQGAVVAFNGLNGHYRFEPGATDEVWKFGTAQGSITCGVVRAQTFWTSTSGGIYQPSTLKNWGATVAPGVYRAAADTDIVQPCFIQRSGNPTSVTSGQMDPDTLQGVDLLEAVPATTAAGSPEQGSPPTGQLQSGDSAIIGVDAPTNALTLETNGLDVRYTACPSFRASSPTGGQLGLAALRIGDFATVNVDPAVPCLNRVSLLTAPKPPRCRDLNDGGHLDGVWVGFDQGARSVVYTEGNQFQTTVAMHWCQPPTVVGSDGSATTLAAIPSGADVQLTMSGNVWVTAVTIEPPGSIQPPAELPAIG